MASGHLASMKATKPYVYLRGLKRQWRARQEIRQWEGAGRPVPPPHAVKQALVREYARKFKLRTLVETGTYLGDMVAAMCNEFAQIYSVELDRTLFDNAQKRFENLNHITLMCGDSGELLPQILKDIHEPSLFWLDGHWSGGITAQGSNKTPIVSELHAISRHHVAGHLLLIDDARCFNGSDGYPTLADLQSQLEQFLPHATFEVADDVVRIFSR